MGAAIKGGLLMFEFKGFDDLSKELNKLSKNAKKLDGENQVPFSSLFTKKFMAKYTNFSSFDELLEDGGFIVNSEEDFEAIPEDLFDNHINSVTKFSTWQDMLNKATEIWIEKELLK